MSERTKYLVSFLVIGGSFAIAIVLFLSKEGPRDRDFVDLTQPVNVVTVDSFSGSLNMEVSGIVKPHREIKIAAQASGQVVEKPPGVRAGTFVDFDTVLLKIDTRDYELQIDRLNAEVAQAESSIRELDDELAGLNDSMQIAKRDFDLHNAELQRRLSIGASLSQTELDQAKRNVMGAERTLTELQNAIRSAKTSRSRLESGIDLSKSLLAKAQLDLERTTIKAPFDGVIVSDMVEQGDYVRVGDQVFAFEDTSKADIQCNLRNDQLQQILKYRTSDSRYDIDSNISAYQLPPTPVKIYSDVSGQRVEWSGTLQRYDGIGVDEQTKMIRCRVVVDDPISKSNGNHVALVRNMLVQISIGLNVAGRDEVPLLTIPEIALQPGDFVWSLIDNRLTRSKVTVLDRINPNAPARERMAVVRPESGDLKSGSLVVVSALSQPNPGTEVRIIESSAETQATSIDSEIPGAEISPDMPTDSKTSLPVTDQKVGAGEKSVGESAEGAGKPS